MFKVERKLKGMLLEMLPERFLVNLKKNHYLNALKKFDEENEPDITALTNFVEKGDTVVDVGANVGWYTKILAELVGSKGKVISVEPIIETFSLLTYCMKKLSFSNIVFLNCAISEREGISKMEVPKYSFGGLDFYRARIIKTNKQGPRLKTFSVVLKTLDCIFGGDSENKISFIKCDVEGHELEVVKGASQVILRFKPVWLIEVCSNPAKENSPASILFKIMSEYGYNAYWFDGKKFNEYYNGCKSLNYFFFTSTQLEKLSKKEL